MTMSLKWWQDANVLTNNIMREPGVEPGCPKAPDPKSSTPPAETPNNGPAPRTNPHRSASVRTEDVTPDVTRPYIPPCPQDRPAAPSAMQRAGVRV